MDIEEFDTEHDLMDDTTLDLGNIDFGAQNDDVVKVIEDFLKDVEEGERLYGTAAVQEALEALLPGFETADLENLENELIGESLGLVLKGIATKGRGMASKTLNYLKGIFTPSGRKARAAARAKRKKKAAEKALKGGGAADTASDVGKLTAADAATDLMTTMATKNWDQEVDIARISTEDEMYTRNEKLEDLILKTNDAIEKMTQAMLDTQKALGIKLDDIDTSVDDSIAAQTGETTGQVKSRQGVTGSRATPAKKKDKKDKDKKDKEPERAADAGLPSLET